ncbi:MAG: hypothetical protein GY710_20370 [Desulfobacteraceae bacterium]|nr:hypothetical protein [Desulfobacteraceae bacterium]
MMARRLRFKIQKKHVDYIIKTFNLPRPDGYFRLGKYHYIDIWEGCGDAIPIKTNFEKKAYYAILLAMIQHNPYDLFQVSDMDPGIFAQLNLYKMFFTDSKEGIRGIQFFSWAGISYMPLFQQLSEMEFETFRSAPNLGTGSPQTSPPPNNLENIIRQCINVFTPKRAEVTDEMARRIHASHLGTQYMKKIFDHDVSQQTQALYPQQDTSVIKICEKVSSRYKSASRFHVSFQKIENTLMEEVGIMEATLSRLESIENEAWNNQSYCYKTLCKSSLGKRAEQIALSAHRAKKKAAAIVLKLKDKAKPTMELFQTGSIRRKTCGPGIKKIIVGQFVQFCDIYNSRRTARITIADAYKTAAQNYYTTLVQSKRWYDTNKFSRKFGALLKIDGNIVKYRDQNYIFNTDIATLELHINDTLSICFKQMTKWWRSDKYAKSRAINCLKASDLRIFGTFFRDPNQKNNKQWKALDRYRSHNQKVLDNITKTVNYWLGLYELSTKKTDFKSKQKKKALQVSILSNANPVYSQRADSQSGSLSRLKMDIALYEARKKSKDPLVSAGMLKPSGPISQVKVPVLPIFDNGDQIIENGMNQVEILENSLKNLECWQILYQAIENTIDYTRKVNVEPKGKKDAISEHYRLKCINMETSLHEGKLLTQRCIRDARKPISNQDQARLCQLLWILVKKPAKVQRRTGFFATSGYTNTMLRILDECQEIIFKKENFATKNPFFAHHTFLGWLQTARYSKIVRRFKTLQRTNLNNMVLKEDL